MTHELEQGTNATLVAVRNGPGARLRAAREASGFTQLEVAQQLRLSVDMIARLEEDNYDPAMPLVFVKGYLRSYAGLIGIDPEQIIAEFGHLGIKDPVRDVPDLAQSPQRKLSNFNSGTPKHRPGLLWGSLAIFACGMLAFMWMYRDQMPSLGTPDGVSLKTSSSIINKSTEETELNAALEAARQNNAAEARAADGTTATAPIVDVVPPPSPILPAIVPNKAAASGSSEDEDEEPAMKPVSVNTTKAVPKRASAPKTHETMLF